jgi:hypothetical protein
MEWTEFRIMIVQVFKEIGKLVIAIVLIMFGYVYTKK